VRDSPSVNLTIHAGTVVCPERRRAASAEACTVCPAFRGLGRANVDVVCLAAYLPMARSTACCSSGESATAGRPRSISFM